MTIRTPKFLILSFETTSVEKQDLQLQHVFLTFADVGECFNALDCRREQILMITNQIACFVNPFTVDDFFHQKLPNHYFLNKPCYTELDHDDALQGAKKGYQSITIESSQIQAFITRALQGVDYLIMHNAQAFGVTILNKYGINYKDQTIIDTKTDIPYPAHIRTRDFTHLCAEHNFLPYYSRKTDIPTLRTQKVNEALLKLINLYGYVNILNIVNGPRKVLQVRAPFEMNEKIKSLGFIFSSEAKCWELLVDEKKCNEIANIIDPKYLSFKV